MTPLNVPFREKDEAKALGARWNPARRFWFVPDGVDTAPFSRWLEGEAASPGAESPAPTAPPSELGERSNLSLQQLLQQLRGALSERFPAPLWVRAELVDARQRGAKRHCFLELAEHDEAGQIIAQAEAVLWQNRRDRVEQTFLEATGQPLAAGLGVLLLVEVDYNPRWGRLQLVVQDIDPRFTLGDMAAKRQAIRQTLEAEQLWGANRRLPTPLEFCRVGVISPAQAAGLGDFRRDADRLAAAGLVQFDYVAATFEGAKAPASLVAALDRFTQSPQPLDAIVIIRGGGAVAGLNWLNDLALARALCRAPYPIFTGIGHEKDRTILDDIARQSFDTPSKVIAHIRDTVVSNALGARERWQQIMTASERRLSQGQRLLGLQQQLIHHSAQRRLVRSKSQLGQRASILHRQVLRQLQSARHGQSQQRWLLQQGVQRLLVAERLRCQQHQRAVAQQARHALRRQHRALTDLHPRWLRQAQSLLKRQRRELAQLAETVLGHRPSRVLKRGFALVRGGDGIITSRRQALTQRQLTLEFHDGTIEVTRRDADAD